jgi:predicted nucleotidyltransferase component of viral defense system
MNRSRAWFEAVARETGYRVDTLEKVTRLGELAAEVARHPLLGRVLALKGGTALNLAFGPPSRLSVDLDFNYGGAEERERMLEERPDVERAAAAIARAGDYQLQWSRAEHAGRKAYLRYLSTTGTRDRIEFDLNFLHRVPLDPPVRAELWQPGDAERPMVRMVGVVELACGKLLASLDRAAPRDLYDVSRLPSVVGNSWGTPWMRSLFVALAGILDHPVHSYSPDRWRRVTDRVVEEQLHPMLAESARPKAVDLRDAAWEVVEPLLDLTPAEREYTDRIHAGELRPDLLFTDDPELAARVARHPALLWKSENARRYQKGPG